MAVRIFEGIESRRMEFSLLFTEWLDAGEFGERSWGFFWILVREPPPPKKQIFLDIFLFKYFF